MKKTIVFFLVCLATLACKAQVLTGSFIFGGYIRTYQLHLPTGWQPGSHYPLVLDFHYLGADGADEDGLTRFGPIANAENFIVCHPSGSGTNWEVGQAVPYSSGLGDVDFVNALIDTLDGRYGVEQNQVYAVGMGQGGFMVHQLACQLSHRIAAFAAVGASIADSTAYYCQSNRPIPMMIVHGTADSVIEYNVGLAGIWQSIPDVLDFWRNRDTCGTTVDSVDLPDLVQEGSTIRTYQWSCAQGSEILHYKVIGGGFSWPGGAFDLGSGGVRNMDINASQHVWNFFKRHALNGVVAVENPQILPASSLSIYPQPAASSIHVKIEDGRLNMLKIIDLNGQRVEAPIFHSSSNECTIDVSGIPAGLYVLQAGTLSRRISILR